MKYFMVYEFETATGNNGKANTEIDYIGGILGIHDIIEIERYIRDNTPHLRVLGVKHVVVVNWKPFEVN